MNSFKNIVYVLFASMFLLFFSRAIPAFALNLNDTEKSNHHLYKPLISATSPYQSYLRTSHYEGNVLLISNLLQQAALGENTDVQYIVVGSSSRDNIYSRSLPYYASQLDKIGVELIDNAKSGQKAYNWANNISGTTVNNAIASTSGTGSNAIMEISIALNDWQDGRGKDYNKTYIKDILRTGIDSYLDAKPDAKILLVTPVPSIYPLIKETYIEAYQELAIEYDFPLVHSEIPLSSRFDEKRRRLFFDSTHLNSRGTIRLTDYIFDQIMDEATRLQASTPYLNSGISEELWHRDYLRNGYRVSSTTGTLVANSASTATSLIPVEYGATYKLTWRGNKDSMVYFDSNQNPIMFYYSDGNVNTPQFFPFTANDTHRRIEKVFTVHHKDARFISFNLNYDYAESENDVFDPDSLVSLQRINHNQADIIGPRSVISTSLGEGTLFIAVDGSSGETCGSVANPCNLRAGLAKDQPGDVVFFREGIYKLSDTSDSLPYLNLLGGTEESLTIYESYPGETAVFDGELLDRESWTPGILFREGEDYIHLRNIEITNTPAIAIIVRSKYNIIEGVIAHDNDHSGIVVAHSGTPSLEEYNDAASYNIIRDCELYNNSDVARSGGGNADGIALVDGVGNIVTHNTIYGNSDDGIDTWRSNDTIVSYNLVFDNGRGPNGDGNGIKTGGSNDLNDGFGVNCTVFINVSFSNRRHGVDFNSGKRSEFLYNTSYDNGGLGYKTSAETGSHDFDTTTKYNIASNNAQAQNAYQASNYLHNSWQRSGDVAFISTDPLSPYFLQPIVEGEFEDIGARIDANRFEDDLTSPTVASITRAGANPTYTSSIDFTVTFSENMDGVDTSDFTLTTTGEITGASILTSTGSGTTYTVTVDTGSDSGTIRLDLVDNGSILDESGSPLGGSGVGTGSYTNGEVYTIDKSNNYIEYATDLEDETTYQNSINTEDATSSDSDPVLPNQCGIDSNNKKGQATVWYKYYLTNDDAISFDTTGSGYDTFIAIWEGADINSLLFVACNDDTGGTEQSAVAIRVTGNKTYYIEIGQP